MIQIQYMASWVPPFLAAMEAETAARNNNPPFTVFQLATVNSEGFPHNRTLVSRGFLFDDKTTNVLTFCTDKRTDKYRELRQNDRFEAVFYFENIRKQFRIRGRARIVDDSHVPTFDLTTIQPKHIIEKNIHSSVNSSDSESEDEDSLEFSVKKAVSAGTAPTTEDSASPAAISDSSASVDVQSTPLPCHIMSPKLINKIKTEADSVSMSFANLHDLSSMDFHQPSAEEWNNELLRSWGSLSKAMKRTFRGPPPRVPMDEQHQNLIDKIDRGVDGKKEENGLQNFALVAMFPEHVDYFDSEKKRRYIFQKDEGHHWSEEEVCP